VPQIPIIHERRCEMPPNLTEEALIRLIHQQSQAMGVSPEELLLKFMTTPFRISVDRARLVDEPNSGIISEKRQSTSLDQNGMIQDIEEKNIFMLDDGLPTTGEIARCQTCGRVVKLESLRRCYCGKTCCVSRGCGKHDRGKWYCCTLHRVVAGRLGINLLSRV
jgi:hypothetical protein